MSGQSSDVSVLFAKRMQLITQISQENAGRLRILQRHSGHEVLSMKSPESAEINAIQQETETQLDMCRKRIEALELELSEIDKQIAAAALEEDQDG